MTFACPGRLCKHNTGERQKRLACRIGRAAAVVVRRGISSTGRMLEELDADVQERRSEAAEDLVGSITSRTSEIGGFLDDVQSDVDDLRTQIGDLQTRVATLKGRVPLWIDLGSIAITLLFLWLAISQVSVFIHGWSLFTGQDWLGRWR